MSASAEHFWKSKARRVVAKRNAATWLRYFLPTLLAGCFLAAFAILLLRRQEQPIDPVWWVLGGGLLMALLGCLGRVRNSFYDQEKALVRLDVTTRLHNRLASASAGVGAWPVADSDADDGLRWRWSKILPPILLSFALLTAAVSVPLPRAEKAADRPEKPPVALAEVEKWLEEIKEEKVADEQALEQLAERIEALQERPPEEWYAHSNLEAADSLREETEGSLRELASHLEQAASALAAAEQSQETWGALDRAKMQAALSAALKGLEAGKLPLDAKLLAQLKALDLKDVKNLSAAQLAALRARMAKAGETCAACLSDAQLKKRFAAISAKTGRGGPGGGGPAAELTARETPTQLGSKSIETVSNDDLSRALPGEVLATQKGEHEADESFAGPVAGGAAVTAGAGGDAVWRESLNPGEQTVLREYFQ